MLRGLRNGFQHAFSVQPHTDALAPEDRELLTRLAAIVVSRGMAAPATVFLESMGPMNFLGSQALHFFAPIIELACSAQDIERIAHLLERRDTVSRLIGLIESASRSERASG
ncbi:hypothetical protein [Nitrospira sp. KM1]|uniref:hypothetical protein n=1 Tax=Nitrospira sp. KM1 TaxID=1936990 RepID=UPI00156789AE|nr:hypothetical protein [Nitrospira sp. KM1]